MAFLLLFLIIIATGGFGIFPNIEGISIPLLIGRLETSQTVLFLTFVALFFVKKRAKLETYNPIFKIYFFFLVIVLLAIIINLLEGYGIKFAGNSLKKVYMLFSFFPLAIYAISTDKWKKFIDMIVFISVIGAFVAIYQYITGISLYGSNVALQEGTMVRVYHPMSFIMSFSIYYVVVTLTTGKKNAMKALYITALIILIIGVGTTLHRSLLGVTLIGSILIYLINIFKYKGKSVISLIILAGTLLSVLYPLAQAVGITPDIIFFRADSAVGEISTFSGNYFNRWLLLITTFNFALANNMILGIGFTFGDLYNPFHPLSVTMDNTYRNIMIIWGLSGLILYLSFIISCLLTSLKIVLKSRNEQVRIFSLLSLAYSFHLLIISMFSENIIYAPHLTVIILTLVTLYVAVKNYNLEKENSK